jgi:hypothetical protein
MAAQNAFLDHDSFVELNMLHFFSESELRSAVTLGEMTPLECVNLARTAQRAETLTQDLQDLIWSRLAG